MVGLCGWLVLTLVRRACGTEAGNPLGWELSRLHPHPHPAARPGLGVPLGRWWWLVPRVEEASMSNKSSVAFASSTAGKEKVLWEVLLQWDVSDHRSCFSPHTSLLCSSETQTLGSGEGAFLICVL